MNDVSSRLLSGNRLLSALPEAEWAMLRPHTETVPLPVGKILANPGDKVSQCYFPTKGMISLLSVTEQGETIEVAYVGREGTAGIAAAIGGPEVLYQMMVQADTECIVADSDAVRELFIKGPIFHDLLLRYVYALLQQMSQTCLCNHFHTIEQRLCRWLTVMCERSGNHRLSLTQEFLAHMLGVQRTSIGMITQAMKAKGIIRYSRGRLEVVNPERVRASACECYQIVNTEYENLYKPPARRQAHR
jgi:cAMP-binding proteins - catabolite gene activator and regulatory subunit of cAMP-dependent protein kinases